MTGAAVDDAAGYEALRHGVGAHVLARDVVRVAGPEATSYLQGQLSQDVAPIDVGGSAPALLLEPDGKLSALVRVTRVGDDAYVCDTDAGFGDVVAARLRRFRLRTKVEIEPVEWACVALRGDGVAGALEGGGAGPPWLVAVEWNGTHGADLLGPGAEARVPPGAKWCGDAAWEALRIEAGIPEMGTDLDGRTIAAEAGLVERTVSFTKGCYTGQELVARLDSRGSKVARRLCGVVADGLASGDVDKLLGAVLVAPGGDKEVGRCTSAAWCPGVGAVAGLAFVHRSVELGAALVAGTVDVHARALPLVDG